MTVPASPPSNPSAQPGQPAPARQDPVAQLLAAEQRDRARDRGRFNQYGMRDDPRDPQESDRENPGNGDRARRFGSGGDPSSYANRVPDTKEPAVPDQDASSDSPAHKPGP